MGRVGFDTRPPRQQSSVDRLPDDVRDQLQALLRDPRVTQLDATRRINEILEAEGHAERLSKSAVNRYALKMEEVGARLRESREIADMWIGKLGAAPQGKTGLLVNEFLRAIAFKAGRQLFEVADDADADELPATIQMAKELALAVQRIERATTDNVKREAEIRKQALEAAADAVGEAAHAQGMDEEQARFWREKVLGVR